MRSKLITWGKRAGIAIGWGLAGVLVLAVFVGTLWLSRGTFGGYPALTAALIVSIGMGWVIVRRAASGRGRLVRSLPVAGALLIAFWAMVPMAPGVLEPLPPDPAFETWELGEGRTVSVSHHRPPEGVAARGEAILFVHGGPGAYVRDFDRAFFAGFAEEGFDVFTYDQVGAGRSSIVAKTEYSHAANVADLAAVVDRIDQPLVLVGQSYGAGVVTSYLDQHAPDDRIRGLILTEPGPVPGKPLPDDPHYTEKTTRAESLEGPGPFEMIDSPRFLLAMALPAENRFVPQQELMNYIGPELQDRIVAASFCKTDADSIPDFENLRVNILAHRFIRSSFWDAARPDLTESDIPALLLLGECSNLPRGFAMDYFDVVPIERSHVIPGVGHVLWGNEEGNRLTRSAILSFLDGSEMPLPDEPDYDSRITFIEQGK